MRRSPLDGQALDYTAVVLSPEMLCGDENDVVRREYVAPVLEGELRLQRGEPAGDGRGPKCWPPLTGLWSCF